VIESSTLLPDGEDVLNKGINQDKTLLENSLEERSVRASFCPSSKLKSDFPRAVLLPDCVITQRSLSFFKDFPTILGRMDGMHRKLMTMNGIVWCLFSYLFIVLSFLVLTSTLLFPYPLLSRFYIFICLSS
jgi:hypothetical protein